jgi:uncharacterized protein
LRAKLLFLSFLFAMRIKVSEISEGCTAIEGSLRLSAMAAGQADFVGDVPFKAEIRRAAARLTVKLSYRAAVAMECSRCLRRVQIDFPGEFTLTNSQESSEEGKIPDEQDDLSLYADEEDGTIDLAAAVFDDIIVALPMKPLCSEACTGEAVSDDTRDGESGRGGVDPRWEPLKKLGRR